MVLEIYCFVIATCSGMDEVCLCQRETALQQCILDHLLQTCVGVCVFVGGSMCGGSVRSVCVCVGGNKAHVTTQINITISSSIMKVLTHKTIKC